MPTSPESNWLRTLLTAVAVATAGALSYSNTFAVPFLFDDVGRILEAPQIRTLWPLSTAMDQSNRPFGMLTFAANYAIDQHEVWGYHATNLVIHLLAGLCLLSIVHRTLSVIPKTSIFTEGLVDHSQLIALAIAAIWTVHPLQTQAVTYIVQRLESLMGLSYLATLMFFIGATQSKRPLGWYLLSLLSCAWGMGCKEVMVTAPLIVLWYDRAFVASSWRQLISNRWPFYLSLFCTWGVLAWAMLHYTGDYKSGLLLSVEGLTPWLYLWNQSAVICHYLKLCFVPVGLCLYREWPVENNVLPLIPTAFLLATGAILTFLGMFFRPRLAFMGGCFFLILAPTSSLVPIIDLYFEHRMYLPLAAIVGLCVLSTSYLVFFVFSAARQRRLTLCALTLLATGTLGVLTYDRNHDYRSSIAIWTSNVEVSPSTADGWTNLGIAYVEADQKPASISALRKAAQLKPTAQVLASLGGALIESNDLTAAADALQQALALEPTNYIAVLNQGNLLFELGRYSEAIPHFQAALDVEPDDIELRTSLAACLVFTQRFGEAEYQCRQVLLRDPRSAKAMVNLACALANQGQIKSATAHCRQALSLDPSSPNAHGTLAMLLADDQPADAQKHLAIACRLETKLPVYDIALADMLVVSDPAAAVTHYRSAIAKQPDNVEARLGLIEAYLQSQQKGAAIAELEVLIRLHPEWTALQTELARLRR